VRAAATHAVFAGPALDRLEKAPFTQIAVADTIPVPNEARQRLPNLIVLSRRGDPRRGHRPHSQASIGEQSFQSRISEVATMDIPTVKAETRKASGSRAAGRLRRTGKLPGIVYGHKQDTVPILLDRHDLELHMKHGRICFRWTWSKAQPCLIKDAQYDHLGAMLVHIDLARVDLNERVKVRVPVELRGNPKAWRKVASCGRSSPTWKSSVWWLSIPERIRIDVAHLALGEVL